MKPQWLFLLKASFFYNYSWVTKGRRYNTRTVFSSVSQVTNLLTYDALITSVLWLWIRYWTDWILCVMSNVNITLPKGCWFNPQTRRISSFHITWRQLFPVSYQTHVLLLFRRVGQTSGQRSRFIKQRSWRKWTVRLEVKPHPAGVRSADLHPERERGSERGQGGDTVPRVWVEPLSLSRHLERDTTELLLHYSAHNPQVLCSSAHGHFSSVCCSSFLVKCFGSRYELDSDKSQTLKKRNSEWNPETLN